MPITRVYEGSIDYLQILDKDGNVDKSLEPNLPKDVLERMYRNMVVIRAWDRKCVALQRTGRMYTYAPVEGQEAIGIGAVIAASEKDWLFPTYREAGATYYTRGYPLYLSTLMWMGVEEGLKIDKKYRCFPYAIPIATQLPHAVGAAFALRAKGEKAATLVFCGDGATSEGDFHDALNFAGVLNTPCVFIIVNNQYAISVPRKMQTKSETLAQKALAYGLKGLQVDGNDILAIYKSVKEAADSARAGKGPVVLELVTYRMGPHTTSDDPKRYRNEEEMAYWRERDPIKRFQIYLKNKGIWSEDYEKKLAAQAASMVEAAVVQAEAFKQDPKDIFRYTYANMPKELQKQMKEALG
jgi:pyruvate dehydrogenase E1 component alpha subunit